MGNNFAVLKIASQYSEIHCPTVAGNAPMFICVGPASVMKPDTGARNPVGLQIAADERAIPIAM